ncbi:MAG: hypothetical protein IPN84_17390 [Sphingomonadales bacterium]|jgi:hypothetical protein|nr:hypothetical protein [Sphingomonadales bacterium]
MDDDHYNNDDQSRYSPFDLRNPLYTVYLGDQGYQTSTDRNPTGVFTYGQLAYGALVFIILSLASTYLFN